MDAHVVFESWLERDEAMAMDFDVDVVAFAATERACTEAGWEYRLVTDPRAGAAAATGTLPDHWPATANTSTGAPTA